MRNIQYLHLCVKLDHIVFVHALKIKESSPHSLKKKGVQPQSVQIVLQTLQPRSEGSELQESNQTAMKGNAIYANEG